MFDSFSTAARQAVSRARWHAGRLSAPNLTAQHLLIGVVDLLTEVGGAQPLVDLGVDLDRFRAQLVLRVSRGNAARSVAPLPYSEEALTVLRTALRGAPAEVEAIHLLRAALTSDRATADLADLALRAAHAGYDEVLAAIDVAIAFDEDPSSAVLQPQVRRPDLEIAFHPKLELAQVAVSVRAFGDLVRDCGGRGIEFRFEIQDCRDLGSVSVSAETAASAQLFVASRRDWRTRPGRAFRRLLRVGSGLTELGTLGTQLDAARGLHRQRAEHADTESRSRALAILARDEQLRAQAVTAQSLGDAGTARGEEAALTRFLVAIVGAGMAFALSGARIDLIPHRGALDAESVRVFVDARRASTEDARPR